MLIDFNNLDGKIFSNMNGGQGNITAKFFANDNCKIIISKIPSGASIGNHVQASGDDINFVISGTGIAVCDGSEELLTPGTCHVCPKNSQHSIMNTGSEDLVLYTVVK